MQNSVNPASSSNVEQLVQQLYRPGQPQQIKKLEEHLQTLQSSDEGWQLADTLLQSEDRNVRFFGALTFTIKVNRDYATIVESDRASLPDRLLQHLVRLANEGESALVLKKLCHALVAYYLVPSTTWQHPVLDVMIALGQGQGLRFEGLPSLEVARELGSLQILATLWFAMGLAEQAKQALSVNIQNHRYHERIASSIHDVAALLHVSMDSSIQRDGSGVKIVREGMKCFQSWIMYAQRAGIEKMSQLSPLQVLTPQATQFLRHEELYEESSELLSDILENFPTFLTANDAASLASVLSGPKIQQMITDLVTGDYSVEAAVFARLCLAYGEAYVQDLARREDSELEKILRQLMQLLNHTGYPGVEDEEFCSQALVFWQTYVEFVTDSLYTIEPEYKPSWMLTAGQRILEVLDACCIKIRQPPIDVASGWDADERTNFQAYRNDVQDLLQSSYTLLGVDIFKRFAWLAIKAIREQAWLELEASVFCFNALSDAVSEEPSMDNILSQLLGSALFSEMTSRGNEVPAKTKQIAVTMITKFISFFERHSVFLPDMLNYLFHSLGDPELTNVAAKAISAACSSCRKTLVGEVHAFIQQYEAIQRRDDVDTNTKEKVLGGITAIIQALPTEESKVEPLRILLGFIEWDARSCLDGLNRTPIEAPESETYQTYGISALRCLASMGRALQTPDDTSIDLDAEVPISVWTVGEGANLQKNVTNILQKLTALMPGNNEIVEAACQILRSGFKETTPGLFVFHPEVTVSFLLSTSLQTSRLDLIIYTATAMLIQSSSAPSDMPAAASMCLDFAIKLVNSMDCNPSFEPEIAAGILDLADRCTPRYLTSMSRVPRIDRVFHFALAGLVSADIMPNRSAAAFWSKFTQNYELDSEEATDFQAKALKQYGSTLCRILVHSIAGEVPRSSLDTMADPLRKIIFAQPQAKQWLSDALDDPNFPSQKVDAVQKRMWLQKMMSLRGARKTNNEVKDFWVACRGPSSNFAF